MNNFKNLIKIENRNKFLNYFRLTSYLSHPELKIKSNNERWRTIMIMRDLRLWIIEYTPWSSRTLKYSNEIEQLTRELEYHQFFCKFD